MSAGTGTETIVRPARRVRGRLRVPGDKSISHRYAMLAGLADGASTIRGYAPGADCAATLACLQALGVEMTRAGDRVQVQGRGLRGLRAPSGFLDACNSGTTMRLMAGVLAAHPFESVLTGDDSLLRRPMRRIIDPLERMGARVRAAEGGRAPLTITGADLHGIDFTPLIPSAQVKSAVLLAGLQADGVTRVRESAATRDHTERALGAFGARIAPAAKAGGVIELHGGQHLRGVDVTVPGDLSSAAFWAAAAAALPDSNVELTGVGLNPSRTALLDVLRRVGASVETSLDPGSKNEPVGTLRIRRGTIEPLILRPEEVPGVIDEIPVLAALSTFGAGMTVTGAQELRAKESDRITALVDGLNRLGADAEELPDGFRIAGGRQLRGGTVDAAGDHRLAMAFAIAALGAAGPTVITGAEAVQVSYPGFFETLQSLCE